MNDSSTPHAPSDDAAAPLDGTSMKALLPAVLAPLLALAITLAGAVALVVLLLLAALVGLDLEDVSDGTLGDTPDGVGALALLGLPFQLVAVGLLGTVSLDVSSEGFGDVAGAGVFAPVYLLTALYVFALNRIARKRPAVSGSAQAIALASVVAALTALVLSWALAMRSDGVTVGAASPSLFFGALLTTAGTLAVSRWRRAGMPLPPTAAPFRDATTSLLVHLVVFSALASPVLLFAATVREGMGAGVAVLVLLPTALLYAFGLASLAPMSIAGNSQYAWSDSPFAAVTLLLLALVAAVVTAVVWHLRRARAASNVNDWAVLPLAWAGGGLVLWLASLVVVSGGFAGYGGSARLQVGWSFLLLLPLWGLLVEAASRFLAPTLASALPEAWRVRLAQRASAEGAASDDANPTARPLTAAEKRRVRVGLIVVGGLVVVAVAATVAVRIVQSAVYGPEAVATDYLDAVVDGDVQRAVELAPVDDQAGTALLTSDVFGAAEQRPSGYDISDTSAYGDQVNVSVTLAGVAGQKEHNLLLEKQGTRFGVFTTYEVTEKGLATPVSLSAPEVPETIGVNGKTVSTRGAEQLWALPGTYTFDLYAGSNWVEADPATVSVSPADGGTFVEASEPQPSDELQAAIQEQTDTWLTDCLKSDELDPADCPQDVFAYGESPRNVSWTLQDAPKIELDYFDGTFPATFSSSDGVASVTYEADESYGFGPADYQETTEDADLYFNGQVDLVDGKPVVEFETS